MAGGRQKSARGEHKNRQGKLKLHGVMTEDMVPDQIERAGTHPFTFSGALLITGSVLLGGFVVPLQLSGAGIEFRASALVLQPLFTATALAVSRYFVDSRRGACRGFWVTFVVTLVVCFALLYALLYKGLLLY